MEIADAKQAFLNWNKKSFNHLIEQCEAEQQLALKLLPLLFQTNDRLLPGYNGAHTPAGIYGYKPEKSVISSAKKIYSKFSYEQHKVLNKTIIESIFLQKTVLDGKLYLWVVYIEKLKSDQIEELRNKLKKIIIWLKSRNLDVDGQLLSSSRLAKKSKPQALFLNNFYLESILLAGKYPVWWLVPPEKESDYTSFVEHIKKARFVNENEFIDIGNVSQINSDDYIRLSIKYAQTVYQQPEKSYLNLLLLKNSQDSWPKTSGLAWQLKLKIYSDQKDVEKLYAKSIVVESLQYVIANMALTETHLMPFPKLFSLLSKYSRNVSCEILDDLSIDSAAGFRSLEVGDYLSLYKALFSEIRLVYDLIFTQYQKTEESNANKKLKNTAENMSRFLSTSSDRVAIYNTRERTEFILDRILLRYIIKPSSHDLWVLIIKLEEGEEKIIHEFNSLLALVSWAWLNRIIDPSTQVSIDCPLYMVKQTEAYHVLEVLAQNINPDLVNKTTPRDFEHATRPLQSILFLNLVIDDSYLQQINSITETDDPLSFGGNYENLITNCEQLIVYDWGDVYTRQYSGDDGILQCLCDWMKYAPLSRGVPPQKLRSFGYAAGDSTYIAQRIDQVYAELIQFFYYKKQRDGCFIIRMGPDYYCVEAENDVLCQHRIGDQSALHVFLEQENKSYRPYALERFVLAETPLREILNRNKKAVVQIFFRINNSMSETWVLDEKGSVWFDQQPWVDRSSFVAHWLYMMRNISSRLKKINYQQRELPKIEIQQITNNQLGGLDFSPIGSETLSVERGFIDIHVKLDAQKEADQISLICDGREFDSVVYGDQVIAECMQYAAEIMRREGNKPVYVTDINVPLRIFSVEDRDDIQVLHFLKYKRNIEKRLNQVVSRAI